MAGSVLIGSPSTQSPSAWALVNYIKSVILGKLTDNGYRYVITPTETANGLTNADLTFGFEPGDLRRYGCDPTNTNDSSANIAKAISSGHTLLGGGANCMYKTSTSIDVKSFTEFDGQGCTINITADVPAITNATGAAVDYVRIRNVALRTSFGSGTTSAAMDLVDFNRSTFERIQIDRETAGAAWGYGIRLRTSASVCLWNRFVDIEADAVNTGFISIETANCNQNVFFSAKLINDSAINLPYGVKITSGSDNAFYNLDLEASFHNAGAGDAYGLYFNSGTNNKVYGLRTEGYANASNFYGINWNGTVGNVVLGHYHTGFGDLGDQTGIAYGSVYLREGATAYMGGNTLLGIKGELTYDSVSDRFHGNTNAGARLVVQSPALDAQDLNGNNLENVATLQLTAAASAGSGSNVYLGNGTATTASAGTNGGVPAQVVGYLIFFIGNVEYKIPYYAL